MHHKKILISIFLFLNFTLIFSCKKDIKNGINIDCTNLFPIKDFEIFERLADTILSTNAALTSSAVIFKASDKYDSVKWIIGNDARTFREKQVSLIFNDPGMINVTLIGSINIMYQCSSKNVDTITKQLEIRNTRNSYLTGKYKGIRVSNPIDTFILEIKQVNDSSWYNEYFIYNFPKGCTVWSPPFPQNTGYLISAGAKNFRIRNDLPAIQECLFEIYGVGKLSKLDSLTLYFNFRASQGNPQLTTDKFLGKKL